VRSRDLAVVVAVALVALFAAVDGLRTGPSPGPSPAERGRLVEPRTAAPTPPGPTSRHVQRLMKSDVRLHGVRANRAYCRRDLAVLCFRDQSD
jgi:hypothetical protein